MASRHGRTVSQELLIDVRQQNRYFEFLTVEDLLPEIASRGAIFHRQRPAGGSLSLEGNTHEYGLKGARHHQAQIAGLCIGDLGAWRGRPGRWLRRSPVHKPWKCKNHA